MVRFIIIAIALPGNRDSLIYIPIWLDLLYNIGYGKVKSWTDLHSNMVRFIMLADYRAWANATEFTFQYG